MNVHHLQLFYYVAKHRGITPALAHIPWGIQQPAVSGAMRALEQERGARLFHRKPFFLTPDGAEHRDVRVLPLRGFDPVRIGAYCHKPPPVLVKLLIAVLLRRAQTNWSKPSA